MVSERDLRSADFDTNQTFFRRAAGIASILYYLKTEGIITAHYKSRRLVELGCGDGSGLWVFGNLGAEITGVDLQKYPQIDFYQRSPLVEGIPYFEGTSLDFLRRQESGSLDGIFAFNVESDVWTDEVVEEAYRALRRDSSVVVTWQGLNLSSADSSWPRGWPNWPSRREFLRIYDPSLGPGEGHVIKDLIDPRLLAAGVAISNPRVSHDDVAMPDTFVMIGRKF